VQRSASVTSVVENSLKSWFTTEEGLKDLNEK